MSDYCGACYCNAKCEKKHIKCFKRKLDKYNNKEARKKMIESDARQALKDAEKVRDKPARIHPESSNRLCTLYSSHLPHSQT